MNVSFTVERTDCNTTHSEHIIMVTKHPHSVRDGSCLFMVIMSILLMNYIEAIIEFLLMIS